MHAWNQPTNPSITQSITISTFASQPARPPACQPASQPASLPARPASSRDSLLSSRLVSSRLGRRRRRRSVGRSELCPALPCPALSLRLRLRLRLFPCEHSDTHTQHTHTYHTFPCNNFPCHRSPGAPPSSPSPHAWLYDMAVRHGWPAVLPLLKSRGCTCVSVLGDGGVSGLERVPDPGRHLGRWASHGHHGHHLSHHMALRHLVSLFSPQGPCLVSLCTPRLHWTEGSLASPLLKVRGGGGGDRSCRNHQVWRLGQDLYSNGEGEKENSRL
ncbi:hypothetical protein B0T16DRAFT_11842 [Cercophora newfieldiana]|uniref:Uncharacterized protein n=1 Tax=Cercophora newfieldiana TaxID=92897 RepID=A0AA39YPL6_9PEZI|nr:hypothetical protein B0T16DRAFT_11842 [Cercophora newfieldiana]